MEIMLLTFAPQLSRRRITRAINAAKRAAGHGLGMASVRFICGTRDSHKRWEQKAGKLPRHACDSVLLFRC